MSKRYRGIEALRELANDVSPRTCIKDVLNKERDYDKYPSYTLKASLERIAYEIDPTAVDCDGDRVYFGDRVKVDGTEGIALFVYLDGDTLLNYVIYQDGHSDAVFAKRLSVVAHV